MARIGNRADRTHKRPLEIGEFPDDRSPRMGGILVVVLVTMAGWPIGGLAAMAWVSITED